MKKNVRKLIALATLFLTTVACSPEIDPNNSSKLHTSIDSLKLEALYHGSLASSFAGNHPSFPTTDGRFPGGPAWFSPNIKELSIWRAGQIAANQHQHAETEQMIFVHQYKLKQDTDILDLTHMDSSTFYEDLGNMFEGELSEDKRITTNLADFYFKKNPEVDGFLIKDSVSGMPELVLRDPAKHLRFLGNPTAYEITAEFGCLSCKPKRFIIRGPDKSYALIPDKNCIPGYYIQKI